MISVLLNYGHVSINVQHYTGYIHVQTRDIRIRRHVTYQVSQCDIYLYKEFILHIYLHPILQAHAILHIAGK
jgi:hypothetical protein